MCVRRVLVVMVLVLGFAPSARAGQTRPDADRVRDITHTIEARRILMEEPELADLNIGVTVRNRVATLWGPVPSAENAFRAELCLRTMIELAEVRSELFVSDQLEDRRPPIKMIRPAPLMLPDRLPPKLPMERGPVYPMPELQVPQELSEIKPKAAAAIKVVRPDASPVPMLGESQPDNMTQAERALAAAVRTVLQGKTAYREVQFAVKDGRVYLKAAAINTDVLHEVARAVARLPNVEGVIVLDKTR